MRLDNEKQATEFLLETQDAYKPVAHAVMLRMALDRCMYEGCHWITGGVDFNVSASTGRRRTNWNPDSNKLLATVNRIIPLIRECSAATLPKSMEVDVYSPDRDMGIEAAEKSQVLESVLNVAIEETGYLEAANVANFRRCIDGTHGILLRVKLGERNVDGQPEQDQVLTAEAFDSTDLTLDPFVQHRDLEKHEHVTYSKAWTVDAIRRYFPNVKLEENDLQTVGELRKLEMEMNRLSENRLYTNLPKYSKTKGAIVHQMHVKDEYGRFSTMLVGIRTPKKDVEWINFDNQESPFGGVTGLPFMMLHGAMRPDSMWSISDAYLLTDDQNRINLLNTFNFRILQKSAGFQWLVANESFNGKDADNFKQQFNNYVAGVITYNGGRGTNSVQAPQLIQTPTPQPFIQEMVKEYESAQRRMVHREDITSGGYKTHTTNDTFQTANENAQQVLGNRVVEDTRRHETMLGTIMGTYVKLAQAGSPSALASLSRAGFDEQDFAVVAATDPAYPACTIKVRESSIRNESKDKKEARMWKAVELQALSPQKLRMALAEMDTPMDDSDKMMMTAARKAANRVLLGEEWPGEMLGEYGDMFVSEFRRALMDRRATLDPAAKDRVRMAIQNQLAYANMEMQQSVAAQQPPPPPVAPGSEGEGAVEPAQEVSIVDLINSLNSGAGSGSSAQPQAA